VIEKSSTSKNQTAGWARTEKKKKKKEFNLSVSQRGKKGERHADSKWGSAEGVTEGLPGCRETLSVGGKEKERHDSGVAASKLLI